MRTILLCGVVFLLSATGCGGKVCNANTCSGCCSANGTCELGNSSSACGTLGSQCSTCLVGTSCSIGGFCSTGGLGGGGGSTSATGGGGGGRSSNSGGGGGTNSTAPSCAGPDDCPTWFCDCQTGPPVNSRRCVNNRCLDGASACPGACSAFSTCWVGTSSGGFTSGSNTGPSTCTGSGGGSGSGGGGGNSSTCNVTDLGKECDGPSDCQANLCFGSAPSFICTKACTQANDCPRDWTCDSTSVGGKVCMIGSTTGTTRSTSSACTPVSYPDVGGPCTSTCSGGLCTGSTCSRRCNTSSDCPGTWVCTTASDQSLKFCTP